MTFADDTVSSSEYGEGSALQSSATSAATSGVFAVGKHACRVFTRGTRKDGGSAGEGLSHPLLDVTSSHVSKQKAAVFQFSDVDVCKQEGIKTTSNKREPKSTSSVKSNAEFDHMCLPGYISGIGSLPMTVMCLKPPDCTVSVAGI